MKGWQTSASQAGRAGNGNADRAIPGGIGAVATTDAARRAIGEPGTLRRRYWSLGFGKEQRAEAWQLLANVLEGDGGGDLSELMEAAAEGYRAQGKRSVEMALLDIRRGLAENAIQRRLAPYVGTAEKILFESLGAAPPAPIFAGAARILQGQLAIDRAITGALGMPVLLIALLLGLVFLSGHMLVPAFEGIVDFGQLPPLQAQVVSFTKAFAARPWVVGTVIGGLIALVALLNRFWIGPGRAIADQVPPFSLSRMRAGAAFLLAVVEYGRTGNEITTTFLGRMAETLPPYPRSRIRALARNFNAAGNNLGQASQLAGQGFPAPELNAVIGTLWKRKGGVERIGDIVERWLERVERTVKTRMAILNGILLAVVSGALLLLMSIGLPIADQLNSLSY